MKARALTYNEYVVEGLPELERVFSNPDAEEPVVAPDVEAAAIIYPVWCFDRDQWEVLAGAAAAAGDDSLWATARWRTDWFETQTPARFRITDQRLLSLTDNWRLPLAGFEQYAATRFASAGSDHTLHSPAGSWAILIGSEIQAVIAGRSSFVDALLDGLPLEKEYAPARTSVEQWLDEGRELFDSLGGIGKAQDPWWPKATISVYGVERARDLLAANGWPEFVPD